MSQAIIEDVENWLDSLVFQERYPACAYMTARLDAANVTDNLRMRVSKRTLDRIDLQAKFASRMHA